MLILIIFVTIPRVTKFSTHEIFHTIRHSRIGLRESRNLKPRKLILKTRDSFSRKFAPPKITRYTVYSQLINKPRVVVTDLRLHHTCSILLWLHSLSGVIRSLLCNTCAFSPGIINIACARTRKCTVTSERIVFS